MSVVKKPLIVVKQREPAVIGPPRSAELGDDLDHSQRERRAAEERRRAEELAALGDVQKGD